MSQIPDAYRQMTAAHFSLRSAILLALRLDWGFEFAQTGRGKLHCLPKVTEFFTSLRIPFPGLSAPFISVWSWWAAFSVRLYSADTIFARRLKAAGLL